MLLICFCSFLHAIPKKISHKCNSPHNNIQNYQKGASINYIISCQSKRTQYVNLNWYENINSISISEESNVFITCENETSKFSKINLFINDNPNITFKSHCYFNTIEIMGSPTINLYPYSDITVRNVVLRNTSYSLPFNSHYYIYSSDIRLSNTNSNTKYSNCSRLIITLSDEINSYCNTSDDDFFFEKSIQFVNKTTNPDKIEEIFDKILPYLNFSKDTKIIFTDFYNIESITPTIETIKYLGNNIYLNMQWDNLYDSHECAWEIGEFSPQFQYMKYYFDYLSEKTNWRKVCFYNSAYLYLQEDKDIDIIIIPTVASFIIIISIILFIIFLVILAILLAYRKFRKENIKKSQVENENSDYSYSSNHFSKQD